MQLCDVLYSAKDTKQMANVMQYRVCVAIESVCDVVNTVRVMTPNSGCDVTRIVYMWPYILDVVSYIEALMS